LNSSNSPGDVLALMIAMRSQALTVLILSTLAAPALAQSTASLSGRVVERGVNAGLAGATIEIAGRRVATDIMGRFSVTGLSTGRQLLKVTAFGYLGREVPILIRGDTTVVIELETSPIPLDPVFVEGRTVTVRGEIYERGGDLPLINVEVRIEPHRESLTDSNGRFKIEDVPAGPTLRLSVRGFGYLPIESIVSVFEDTTLVINLEPDPLVQRMIQHQVERLEKRARPFFTAVMPAMDRDYLLRNRNATALDLIRHRYRLFLGRVRCILIDDRQRYNGLDELAHFFPDELERIEVLDRGRMLRIYTRDYIRTMVGGEVELATPLFVPANPPFCR
jgi:hypothetical protein